MTELDVRLEREWDTVAEWVGQEWRILLGGPLVQAEEPDLYEQGEDQVYELHYDMHGDIRYIRR
jgi:hypothetical protein